MPTASVGAPPARERIVVLADVAARSASIVSGVIVKPQLEIDLRGALRAVSPMIAAGAFIAK